MVTFEQQERWARARARLSLEPDRDDFATVGLTGFLDGPGIAVVVLPADTLAQQVDFSDDLPGMVLPKRFEGATANGVSDLSGETSISSALVRYAQGQEGRWGAFIALERNGGVHGGIGAVARYNLDQGRRPGAGRPALHLFMLAHLIRSIIETQARVLTWASATTPTTHIEGPFEVIVAVPDTAGMVLGGLNQGWDEPKYDLHPPSAIESHVMVRVQLEEWPSEENDLEELALGALDRACEAFGNRRRPYLCRVGPGAGTMNRRYA